jgi:hypothetical protein
MTGKNLIHMMLCMVLGTAIFFPAFPLAGVGAHYGFDLSLTMEDALKEQASLGDLRLDTAFFGGTNPGFTKRYLSGADLPVYIERTNWERHWFNLGGKVFLDIIPFINTLELSVNYGMWQYQGKIIYPTSINFTGTLTNPFSITYDTTMITMKDLGLSNIFVKNTPYAKLQFDLTARKTFLKFPPVVNIFKLYGGAGMSLFFATPLLSAGFIEKTLGNTLAAVTDVNNLQNALFGQNNSNMKKIGEQFMKEVMTPHMGMHFDLGVQLKFPVMPFGIYIDGKFLIPFGNLDKNVSSFKSTGLLINSGISFSL